MAALHKAIPFLYCYSEILFRRPIIILKGRLKPVNP